MDPEMATLTYRLNRLDKEQEADRARVEAAERTLERHEEQISGSGGLVKAMERLGEEVGSLKRALYAFAGSFMVAAITVAIAISHVH